LIAATTGTCVRSPGGRFREDLFYAQLDPDPDSVLSERLEDIPRGTVFLKKYNEPTEKRFRAVATRPGGTARIWPGNVRDWNNVISSACITATETSSIWRICRTPATSRPRVRKATMAAVVAGRVRNLHIQRVLDMCKATACVRRKSWESGHEFVSVLKRDGKNAETPVKSGSTTAIADRSKPATIFTEPAVPVAFHRDARLPPA